MKVLMEKAEYAYVASMLTPRLAERKSLISPAQRAKYTQPETRQQVPHSMNREAKRSNSPNGPEKMMIRQRLAGRLAPACFRKRFAARCLTERS